MTLQTKGSPNNMFTAKELLSGSYKPLQVEAFVRKKWKDMDLLARIDNRLASKHPQGYVEGPPTLNGEPHMGHLRGRVMKDLWYRYETMRGSRIDFRGGWDCQGLPVELSAEKELGLSGNKTANLRVIGEEKLVETCKNMINRYHKIWRESDELLGLLMNDKKAYWTYRDSYIEREWQILRSAWKNGILSEGFRVTPFCPNCQTSLSSAEVALGGYETLQDPSVYFKMRVRELQNTFLVVWTTMPFTVVTDELVGTKPDSEYCFVEVITREGGKETWVVGSERLEALMREVRVENYTVTKRVLGKDLEGIRYEHPLADLIPRQKEIEAENALVHTVVAEEFVDVTTGSGLVHMSPANGEDDFDISQRRKIPVYNPIDSLATFTSEAGAFSGLFVRDSDPKVGEALKERGLLLRYGKLKHEYPVCWRSGHRLVWLARREYFYFVDRLEDKAVEAANKVEFFFEQPKNRFIEIIKEKRPWCVSRERVWGAPIPIWKCNSCGEKIGLFSRKEIVDRAKSLPDGENFELHRPWIDRIVVSCPKCNEDMLREPFVLDTWHNSGAAPYASLTDDEFKHYVPVPFLTEGIDQTRGWAYTLLIENVILKMQSEAPYKAFLFMGHVLDERGEKLSKSKGNFVPVPILLRENSADLSRLYLMWKAGPIDSINFSTKEMATRPYQILNTLYHMHVFYLQNSSFDGFKLTSERVSDALSQVKGSLRKQDKWLLSRLEFVIALCTDGYSSARYHEAARAIEQFLIEDISQTYVPIVRSEMWEETEESRKRRQTIYTVLGYILLHIDKLLHPIAPYLTDFLASQTFELEALTLQDWPEPKPELRDEKLEVELDLLGKTISLTNAARMKGKVKRRWPLKQAYYLVSEEVRDLVLKNKELLLEQANVLNVLLESDPAKTPIKMSAKPNFEIVAPRAKARMNEVANKIAQIDAVQLYKEFASSGKAILPDMPDFELRPQDVQFSFSATDTKYSVSENFGMVVALDTSRDEELISQGLLRDVARNLQALRKEKGFNPTDVLEVAKVADLGTQNFAMLERKKSDLAFLVRVKSVELYPDRPGGSEAWSKTEIDGYEVYVDIC